MTKFAIVVMEVMNMAAKSTAPTHVSQVGDWSTRLETIYLILMLKERKMQKQKNRRIKLVSRTCCIKLQG
ncbi:hypothetical protein LINPERHAP1_LOCUS7139 [Linum perenne]